ncbi:LysR family transcriptional regulator [Vreelandella olivaria]|uniref:LysR family transcriptional regulator n=1 Tax=Vreelandella olivaria TaxID=390919 RepID=UPI00201FA37F|nr:LysR family transcriptional regulator [Halomonas olivaria]
MMESELYGLESQYAPRFKRLPSFGAMEFKLLKVFKIVVESGGFSAAQSHLNVSLASISKQISDLEIRLGMRLCSRGREGFELTAEGQMVYENCLELFRALDDFRDRIYTAHGEVIGELNIGVIDNTVTDEGSPLIEVLSRVMERESKIRLSLHAVSLTDIENGLESGRFSCGVVPRYERHIQLDSLSLYSEKSGLYCGSSHPIFSFDREQSLNDLKGYKFITHSYVGGEQRRKLSSSFEEKSLATQVEAVAILVLTGHYIGVLPHHYARQFVDMGRMKCLARDKCVVETPMELVWSKKTPPSSATQYFIDLLKDYATTNTRDYEHNTQAPR